MDILVAGLLVLCLWGCSFTKGKHVDYIDRSQTEAIKGIFAVVILFSHMQSYLDLKIGGGNLLYTRLLSYTGQLMVVMFLLYSGYGVAESLKRNREKYRKTFLTHRLLKVWLMFAIAVALYFGLSFALGTHYPASHYVLCWTGWESIGNSNWFVFDILVLYLITYLALQICSAVNQNGMGSTVVAVYLLTFIFLLLLVGLRKGAYWYDTIIAYPTGMLYSLYRTRIEASLSRRKNWWAAFIAAAALFAGLRFGLDPLMTKLYAAQSQILIHILKALRLILFVSTSSVFALCLVFLTMKLKLDNAALRWLGVNAFAIYILQRLAMIVYSHHGFNENGLIFAGLVIPTTLLLAAVYTAGTNRLNKYLFR